MSTSASFSPSFKLCVTTLNEIKQISSFSGITSVDTLCWASLGDGGSGSYYLDDCDTSTPGDDFLTVIADDGARWKLLHNGVVSLRQAGVGVTTAMCTDRFNAALSAVNSAGYPELYAPAGQINIDGDGLTCAGKSVTLKGAGKGLTLIRYSGTSWGLSIMPSDIQQSVTLRDFAVLPASQDVASGRPLRVVYPAYSSWCGKTIDASNLDFQSCLSGPSLPYWSAGLYFKNCWNGAIRDIWFTGKPNDWLTTTSFIELGENCTDFVIDCVHGNFSVNWLVFTGYSEGVAVTNSTGVKVYRGINQTATNLLAFRFIGNHINAVGIIFDMIGASQNQISDNILYLTDKASGAFGNFKDCNSGQYSNNTCIASANNPDGFVFTGTSARNKGVGNNFEGTASGILLRSGTSYNRMAMTTRFIAGVPGNPVFDYGTNNTITA